MATTTGLVPAITRATFAKGKVTLTGTSEPGSSIAVYEGYTMVGSATAGSDGTWTLTGAGDANAGDHRVVGC